MSDKISRRYPPLEEHAPQPRRVHNAGRRGLSLRWKLIIGSLVIEVFMLSLLVFNSVRLIENGLEKHTEIRLKEEAVLLNAAIAPLVAAKNYEAVFEIFEATRKERSIDYLAARDLSGRVIAQAGWPTTKDLPSAMLFREGGDKLREQPLENGRLDIRFPIRTGDLLQGEIQLGFSTFLLAEVREHLIQQSILIALVEVALSLVLLLLMGLWLTRHLRTLEEASRDIAAGRPMRPLNLDSGDEIGRLARAFKQMGDEIGERLRALHESEERFRSLAELSSDWYWEQDENFRFTQFLGTAFPESAKKMIGKLRWDSPGFEVPAHVLEEHQRTLEAHKPFRDFEYRTRTNGTSEYVSINGEPLFDHEGRFTGFRGTGKDITRRKLVEEALQSSERKFANLFQGAPLPMALIDLSNGCFSDINTSWSNLFCCPAERVIGRSYKELGLFAEPEGQRVCAEALQRDDSYDSAEMSLLTLKGERIFCRTSGLKLELNGKGFFLWSVRDITRQREAEAQIRELNTHLEARVEERTKELQQALETLHRAKDELVKNEKLVALGRVVAAIAHELNTPIGNSVMVATTMEARSREFAGLVEHGSIRRSQINEYVTGSLSGTEMLLRNLQQAHQLIQSFKQVAADQASERRREFDLKTTCEEILTTMAPSLRKTPHHLVVDIPEGIWMNSYPGPLGQIVINFVNNSLLHAFDDLAAGEMRLSAERLKESDSVRIRFTDNGKGMDEEGLKHAFDPFFTTRLGQGGSGLGLNIVYNLVTRILGGEIDIRSPEGQGVCFTLTLPRVSDPPVGES